MKKRESFMLAFIAFFMKLVFGFLLSPIKNGFVNKTGNTTNNYYDKNNSTVDET